MSKEQKKIVLSGSLNLLYYYLFFLFGVISTFFIARTLNPENWGILLFIMAFITVSSYFCSVLPPAAEATLQFYIPKFKEDMENNNLIRHFIFHVYKIRICLIIFVFIIFHIVIRLLNFNELILQALIISSPMIILISIQNLNSSLLMAFHKFIKVFYGYFLNSIIALIGIIILFFEGLNEPLILIVIIYTLSLFASCFISIIFLLQTIPRKNSDNVIKNSTNRLNYKEAHLKYGLMLLMAGVISQISGLIVNFMYLYFGVIVYLTYITICENMVKISENLSGSSRSSFDAIFSEIDLEKRLDDYRNLFYQINKYLLMAVGVIVGILIFSMEFVILLIYSEKYFVILLGIQFILFSVFAKIIRRNLLIITHSTNKTRIDLYIVIFQSVANLTAVYISLRFFGFFTLILMFIIIQFLLSFFGIFLINRTSELNLKTYIIFKPFMIFLISFLAIIPFILYVNINLFSDMFILNSLFNAFLNTLVFFFVYYLIILFTRYITKEEFNQFINLIPHLIMDRGIFQKLFKLIEKALPATKK
ncbi:MAG: lipopolysaccharide biosynthesis protein [Candidatus Hodarchaeota archaeon]